MSASVAKPIARGPKPGTAAKAKPAAEVQVVGPTTRLPPYTADELSAALWDCHRIQRSARCLAQLRSIGGGPPYVRDGITARYPRDLAHAWAERLLGTPVSNTSEETARKQLNALLRHDDETPE